MLDENLDRRLKRFFGDEHEVVTVQERSWGGKENGELLEDAQREFDALIPGLFMNAFEGSRKGPP